MSQRQQQRLSDQTSLAKELIVMRLEDQGQIKTDATEQLMSTSKPALEKLPDDPSTKDQESTMLWRLLTCFDTYIAITLIFFIGVFCLYLIDQGVFFWNLVDPHDSLKHAVVAELIMVITAACTVFARGFFGKLVSWFILAAMTMGVALFMYAGIDSNLTSKSDNVTALKESREIILESINNLTAIMNDHNKTHLTKRTQLLDRIRAERDKLDDIDEKISEQKAMHSTNESVTIGYSSLLRIIAMVVNTYLIHMLMLIFRRHFETQKAR